MSRDPTVDEVWQTTDDDREADQFVGIDGESITATAADAGKVLTVQDDGSLAWETPSGGGGGGGGAGAGGVMFPSITAARLDSATEQGSVGTIPWSWSGAYSSEVHAQGDIIMGFFISSVDQTITRATWDFTAEGAGAGEQAHVFVANAGALDFLPTTVIGSGSDDIDTGNGTATFSIALTAGTGYWMGMWNPSGNAGSFTTDSTVDVWGPWGTFDADLDRGALRTTGHATLPVDFTAFKLAASASATEFELMPDAARLYVGVA